MIKIIAEVANAHQGDFSKAYKLAQKSKEAGADAVKFQIYFADEMLDKKHPHFNHFKKQSFSENQWTNLIKKTKKLNIKIYCDVFGIRAFKLAKKNMVDGYKIHSSDLNNILLLKQVARENKDVFLSCGGSTISEIAYALTYFNNNKKPILLHGYQSFPTKLEYTNLDRINLLKKEFKDNCLYGYQDHISGSDIYNRYISIAAMGYGIDFLEKHVTLNRKLKGVDYYSSLEPQELKKFILIIKKIHKGFGINQKEFSKDEFAYRNKMKKHLFVKKNFKKGQKVNSNFVEFKRASTQIIHPMDVDYFKGKKLIKNLKKNTILQKSHFFNKTCAVIVARCESRRLPNKALLKINNQHLIEHLVLRVKKSNMCDQMILCTTKKKQDNKIVKIAKKHKVKYFRGEVLDVLKRILDSIKRLKPDIIVRITGDDILIDTNYVKKGIKYFLDNNFDYLDHKNLPPGTETEIFDKSVLNKIFLSADDTLGTEYLTNYVKDNDLYFKTGSAPVSNKHKVNLRLTIDNLSDFNFVKPFLIKMRKENKLSTYCLDDICKFYLKKKRNDAFLKIKNLKKINTNLNISKYYKLI